jgi:hypothetical protein
MVCPKTQKKYNFNAGLGHVLRLGRTMVRPYNWMKPWQ